MSYLSKLWNIRGRINIKWKMYRYVTRHTRTLSTQYFRIIRCLFCSYKKSLFVYLFMSLFHYKINFEERARVSLMYQETEYWKKNFLNKQLYFFNIVPARIDQVVPRNQEISIVEGGFFTIKCNASGTPQPTIDIDSVEPLANGKFVFFYVHELRKPK